MKKNPAAALAILRIGLAFVFIWFGIAQLKAPAHWTSYLPHFLHISGSFGIKLVLLNGVFEIIAGILLAIGAWTQITAFLLALHLFGIAFTIGINAIGVRDLGLAISTLALMFSGAGSFSIDAKAEMNALLGQNPAPTAKR